MAAGLRLGDAVAPTAKHASSRGRFRALRRFVARLDPRTRGRAIDAFERRIAELLALEIDEPNRVLANRAIANHADVIARRLAFEFPESPPNRARRVEAKRRRAKRRSNARRTGAQ